ncbi:MAG: hypothetical protein JSU63_21220 [Phycisphaerales bacterium]|nr:MAG: hypothetical protein JSU63_21220 [Phycisphaerales bacterium]
MPRTLAAPVRKAIEKGLLDVPPHLALFYDLDFLRKRIDTLREAFPPETLHALAIKACPVTELLRRTS